MLSVEDNELITRVGPGTPMGSLMREYWLPALMSSELPAADCDPLRIMLLGEQLIGFRDTNGKVGLIQNHCPHRGASLFFGRNEEAGLRCVYHGWKFDVTGQCVDMPNEPAESNFKNKVRATAYPCVERGGVVWVYMGPRSTPPPLPDLEANMLGEGEWSVSATQRECNWLQALEGDIDTSHFGFLHMGSQKPEDQPEGTFSHYALIDKAPRYEVLDTDGGVMYGAYRDGRPGEDYWRVAQFVLPFYTMPPQGLLGKKVIARCWVPMDDTHIFFITMSPRNRASNRPNAAGPGARPSGAPGFGSRLLPNTTDWFGRFRLAANAANDYEVDREVQRRNEGTNGFTGINGIGLQDQCVTESMGPIYDRSNERLGTSDSMIIRARRRLLNAAKALRDHGITPPGVDNPAAYHVRAGGAFLPKGVNWVEATEGLRAAFVEHPELDAAVSGPLTG
ncbi:MAG TPA: Rieske 2Fe-2S domain-containing protein [Chloroflexota bacterium]|nr:Rieske 2Fe-2S domain-containing protein [Chloroflexota bacterium]